MRIVTGDQDVARLAAETVAHPIRGIAGLQVPRRRKLREWITGAPERFSRLPRAKLAAVPDDGGPGASCGDGGGEPFDIVPPALRERPPRIDVGSDRLCVVNKKDTHEGILVGGMRIRGWLLVLCALLLVWQPLNLALTMAGTLDELSLRGPGLAVILVARLLAAGLGIAAGLSLFQCKPGAVAIAKASLVFSAAVDVAVYATPYSPDNRPPGDATLILMASLAYYAVWLAYLVRSKRVKSTC
jgi:hypothetical protein